MFRHLGAHFQAVKTRKIKVSITALFLSVYTVMSVFLGVTIYFSINIFKTKHVSTLIVKWRLR